LNETELISPAVYRTRQSKRLVQPELCARAIFHPNLANAGT
jgi:hypothetical protein